MDPKKKVSDILKENKIDKEIKILDFVRFKVMKGCNELESSESIH